MKVGIQLFSVRNEMQRDTLGCIRKVAEAGYKYIEPANHTADKEYGVGFGTPAEELKAVLDEVGVKVINLHASPLSEENLKRIIEYQQVLGNDSITLPMTMFPSHERALETAEYCQRMGRICKENGMKFLYHNHYHEFQVLGGERVWDTLVNNTDPDYVGFELDTFWVMRAGLDPVEEMRKLGSRLKKVHQKDFAVDAPQPRNIFEVVKEENITSEVFQKYDNPRDFTEIGYGQMDIQKIIDTANDIGSADYIILEQDFTSLPDEISSIKKSMTGFRKFTGLSWD